MSTATLAPVFIADSLDELNHIPSGIETLAIVPKDDPLLVETLVDALEGKPAVILRLPEKSFDMTSATLQSAIHDAIETTTITHVMLVGSSRYEQALRSDADATLPQDVRDVAHRLMEGAVQQSNCNQIAQQRFKLEISQFLSSALIQPFWNSKSIGVCGLLYRECDGVFVLFDPDTDKFTPLAPTI